MISAFNSDVLGFRFKKSKMWLSFHFVSLNPLNTDNLSEVKFVFDTGAIGILLSRETFEYLGYDNLSYIRNIKIGGITGHAILGKEYQIPGFYVAGKFFIENPTIRVPDIANGCKNLLGQSVLRTRNYYIDNESNLIYFARKELERQL